MQKIISAQDISAAEYFKRSLKELGYTAETFTQTYNNVYSTAPVSVSTVRSWCTGRRSFAKTAAITVQRVAHILEDPNSSITDFERYAGIMYHLINGCRIPIYE